MTTATLHSHTASLGSVEFRDRLIASRNSCFEAAEQDMELSDADLDQVAGGRTTTAGGGVTKTPIMDAVYETAYRLFWY